MLPVLEYKRVFGDITGHSCVSNFLILGDGKRGALLFFQNFDSKILNFFLELRVIVEFCQENQF